MPSETRGRSLSSKPMLFPAAPQVGRHSWLFVISLPFAAHRAVASVKGISLRGVGGQWRWKCSGPRDQGRFPATEAGVK